jgi:hypothetical protein
LYSADIKIQQLSQTFRFPVVKNFACAVRERTAINRRATKQRPINRACSAQSRI